MSASIYSNQRVIKILGPETYQSPPKSYIAGHRQVSEATPPLSRSNHKEKSRRKAEKKHCKKYKNLKFTLSKSMMPIVARCHIGFSSVSGSEGPPDQTSKKSKNLSNMKWCWDLWDSINQEITCQLSKAYSYGLDWSVAWML